MSDNLSMPSALIQLTTPPKREIAYELDWVMKYAIQIDTNPVRLGNYRGYCLFHYLLLAVKHFLDRVLFELSLREIFFIDFFRKGAKV